MKFNFFTFILFGIILYFFINTGNSSFLPVKNILLIQQGTPKIKQFTQKRLKILSWNIHKENHLLQWKNDFKQILLQKSPDIITLQETRLDTDFSLFLQKNNLPAVFAANTYQSEFNAYTGVMNLSKIATLSNQSVLSNQTEPFSKTAKVALFSIYPINQQKLLVINVHALNFHIRLTPFKEQLQHIFEIASRHQGPLILIGDFNTWRKKRTRFLAQLTQKMGLKKVNFGDQTPYIKNIFGEALDAIFYSDKDFKVIQNTADVIEDIQSSDHQALFIELEFRKF